MREKGIRSYMQVEIGKIYEGTVKNITKYGAFVELQMPEEEKVMGMVTSLRSPAAMSTRSAIS